MNYTIYRKSVSNGKGDPSDGSESWTNTTSYDLVSEDNEESYGEYIASECGNQDYSYKVAFEEVAKFYSKRDIKTIQDITRDELKALGFGKCDTCNEIQPVEKGENFIYNSDKECWECRDCEYKSTEESISDMYKNIDGDK